MVTTIGDKLKALARRVYIFFAVPKTTIYHKDLDQLIPEKSEFQMRVEEIMKKVRK